MATQLKKLSIATVFGAVNLRRLIEVTDKAPDGVMPLMRVMGCAVNTKAGESQFGGWTALLGQFEAHNLETGEQFAGSSLFLPDIALTPILVALSAGKGVEFALDIGARVSENKKPGGVPYEYTFSSVLPADAGDPVSRIKERIAALALPAPHNGDAANEADKGKGEGKSEGKGKKAA